MRVLPKSKRVEIDERELEIYFIEQNCTNAILRAAECERLGDLKTAGLYRFVEGLCVKALDRLGGTGVSFLVVIPPAEEAKMSVPAAQTLSQILLRMLREKKEISGDNLIFASGREAGEVIAELFRLELSGKVRKLPGNRYRCVP